MHTILGAGGTISGALTRELMKANHRVRLISRRPVTTSAPTVDWQKADLLNYAELAKAAKGATVLYLCPGLPYDSTIWQQQWPTIVKNAIDVAKANNARLIFLDNVYVYGLVDGPMTEEAPYNPSSIKGEVQAQTAITLMNEVNAGNLRASIARCPDFYGAGTQRSFYDALVLDRVAKGQRALWLGKVDKRHSYLYVPDAGKGMYLLGQHPDSDNQVWHMPTAPALTGREFINLAADVYGTAGKYWSFNKTAMQLMGLFVPFMKNVVEVFYQYDRDYVFDSGKFEQAFVFQPTSYQDGIVELAATLYKPQQAAMATPSLVTG